MLYNVVLFLHILGTVIMFVGVGITITAMVEMLRSSKLETLKFWSTLAVKADTLIPISVILILVPGLYLVFTTWGWGTGWIDISLLTLIILTLMGPIINLRRLKGIMSMAETLNETTPSAGLLEKVRDRILWNSVCIMLMLVLAILFLMTVKLAMLGSLITLVVAIILGLILASFLLNRTVEVSSQHKNKVNV